tara:strand:- start:6 stop:179 length:174 start_codon:yes stop_codon:yes gene_type:complete
VNYILLVEVLDKIELISSTLASVRKPVECKIVFAERKLFSFNFDRIVSTGKDEILRF